MDDIDQWLEDERRPLGICGGCGRSLRHWEPTKCAQCGILLCETCAKNRLVAEPNPRSMRVSPFAPDFPEPGVRDVSDCPCPILDGLDGWRAENARCRTISGRSLGVPALQAVAGALVEP